MTLLLSFVGVINHHTVQVKIYKAILEQKWKKVREFVNTGEIAWTDKVSVYGETSLHLAVGEFKDIEVAKDILKGIRPDLLVTMVDNPYGMNPAHHAALAGNTEALKIMVDCNPDCVHIPDDRYYLPIVPHIKRLKEDKEKHNTTIKMFIDDDGNNVLHLAARLAPIHKLNVVSGAALQMQRELQWFEELKTLVNPKHTQTQNKKGDTPMMVFRKEHQKLRKEGEEWMKKTADSYTITAALIITIVFAAAITVPGGNNGDNGKPIYETYTSFIIFAVSDAVSLFTSTTSLLLFLSILTARYADEDFLYRLPKRLILGLTMLFLSVTSMMIAFSATLYIMFGQEKQWILIPICALACLPIASFVTLQFPLLVELVSSTYGQGIFGKQDDHR
nr:ankyrin repeat family protein [Tanacetum cinerariifolium]